MSRILVIDEDPQVLALIQHLLQELGHQVIVANNHREGVMLYMFWQPVDVVMTDIFMTDINGIDVMAHMVRRGPERWDVQRADVMAMSSSRCICNETVMFGMVRRLEMAVIMEKPSYQRALRGKLEVLLLPMERSEGASGP